MASFEKADTHAKIVAVISDELKIDKSTIKPESTFQDLGADSLDMVQMVMKLEELFGIEINDQDAEKLVNVSEVIDYIQQQRTK
jgi:acyl carrier protein